MNYPLISEYIEAIKSSEDNFEELSYLRLVLDDDGLPVMTSGNFAVVFKMKDEQSGKFYAVKCFTKEQEGRAEAYREIAKELKDVSSPYLVSIRYLEKELFVDTEQTDETEFPVLMMDWVEGKTLDKYLRENLDDKYALEMLAYRFSQLAQWLIPQPFAHGDLKPDNILVREDGTLVLVDYDGMYVLGMYGQHAREMGSIDFRHPQRSKNDFDSHIDDFALVSILLSLGAIYINSHLFDKYSNDGRLLFSADDYRNLGESTLLKEIFPSPVNSINNLTALLVLLCNNQHLNILHSDLLNVDYLSTSSAEYNEKLRDNDGAVYSDDGKRVLGYGSYSEIDKYDIKEGTIVICNFAFNNYENDNHFLKHIHIPSSVSIIGINPFAGCIGLSIYCDSKLFKQEQDILYSNDFSQLISSTNSTTEVLDLNLNTKVIGAYALSFCRAKRIKLPSHLLVIEEFAFSFSEVELLIIPEVVKNISRGAFSDCKFLKDVIIKGETIIDPSIFDGCTNLKHIFVTSSKIEYYKKILSNVANKIYEVGTWEDCLFGVINYAKEIFELGKKYWDGKDVKQDLNEAIELYELASELGNGEAKKELQEWGNRWFDGNKAIYSRDKLTFLGLWSLYTSEYEILEGTESIIDDALCDLGGEIDYSYLDKIVIPTSVTTIGHSPFNKYLSEIVCNSPFFEVENNTLYTKGRERLIQCFAKTEEFVVPNGVQFIDDHAFYGCKSKRITIPKTVKRMGINPFIEMDNDSNTLQIISYSPKFVIENDALYEDRKKLISYWGTDETFSVPNGINEIGEYAFFNSKLKTINMPDTIDSIGDCAFGWCFSLEQVLAPSNSAEKFKKIMDSYQDMIRIEAKKL